MPQQSRTLAAPADDLSLDLNIDIRGGLQLSVSPIPVDLIHPCEL